MPGEYSYFAPVPKITGDFFSPFELLEACFVLRQRKTAAVSMEFSKEVKYPICQKRKSDPNRASKTKSTLLIKKPQKN